MRGIKFKTLLLSLILLKFLDIILTVTAINMGAREINPLGYDLVIIVSIMYLFIFFIIAKYYHKLNSVVLHLSKRKSYKFTIYLLYTLIFMHGVVVLSNTMEIIKMVIK